MTLDTFLFSRTNSAGEFTKEIFKKYMNVFESVITSLSIFENNYVKRLNFSNLAKQLKIPSNEVENMVLLLLSFQEKMRTLFKEHEIKSVKEGNTVFLFTEKITQETQMIQISEEIQEDIENKIIEIVISMSDIKLLNDIIYLFLRVKRGKGIDISHNGSELLQNLKKLKEQYHYLFEEKEGLIYPSKLGLELGMTIQSYNKSSKQITEIDISNYKFKIE